MTHKSKLLLFLDQEMKQAVLEGLDMWFSDPDIAPEVSWTEFRKGLRRIKKHHQNLYDKYMEEYQETSDQDFQKWKEKVNQKNLRKR